MSAAYVVIGNFTPTDDTPPEELVEGEGLTAFLFDTLQEYLDWLNKDGEWHPNHRLFSL